MARERLSKTGKETLEWAKRHKLLVFLLLIVSFGYPIIIGVFFLFGVVAVLKPEVLTALIEAEATIIGFFGLILTYALASFDNRQDRIEQHYYDFAIAITGFKANFEVAEKTLDEIAGTYGPLLTNVKENRKRVVDTSVFVGFLLMLSIFSAILALGIPNEEWGSIFLHFP